MEHLDAVGPNADQITHWNTAGGDKWVRHHAMLDRTLAPFRDLLLETVALKSGERVLDVGCGCGETTRTAARLGADALGVDISAAMLAQARSLAPAGGPEFLLADAETYRFPQAQFDAVISRFGIMFFAHPVAAFSNLRAAMKPGGRLVFLCWRAIAENEWMSVPLTAALSVLPPQPKPDPEAPGPMAFADKSRVESLLRDAGFRDIAIDPAERGVRIAAPGRSALDEAVHNATELGMLSRVLQDVDDDVRAAVRAAVRDAFAPRINSDGLVLEGAVWRVQARA